MNMVEDLIDDLQMSRNPLRTTITTGQQGTETHMEKDTSSEATMAVDLIDDLQLLWNSLQKTVTTGERGIETQIRSPIVESRASSDKITERNIQDGQMSPSPSGSFRMVPIAISDVTIDLGEDSASPAENASTSNVRVVALGSNQSLLAKLERLGFKDQKLNAELLEKNGFDLRKTFKDLCDEDWDPTPGEPQECENTDRNTKDGRIPLSTVSESLEIGPNSSVVFTTDLSRDPASPGEKESTWNAVIASDCTPLNRNRCAETDGPTIKKGACQAHDCITSFRSGSICNNNLFLRCLETRGVDKNHYTLICPFYFGHPTVAEGMMDASSPGQLQSDSGETAGVETPQALAHEGVLPRDKGLLAKVEALSSKDEKLNAELLQWNNFDLCETLDDSCIEEEWDPISGELQELGLYDSSHE